MTLFVVSVLVVLVVSALCSLTEAALYGVSPSYVRHVRESGSLPGRLLAGHKQDMDIPISAILIINTAANTAGAAIAGAQARLLFDSSVLWWFPVWFTLAVLALSEIMPKVVGVAHNRAISLAASVPLSIAVRVLFPVIWVIQKVTRRLKPEADMFQAPEEELQQMATISVEEGSIMPHEAELVRNALQLDRVTARDIMTPRSVVFTLPESTPTNEATRQVAATPYSRIPVSATADQETWIGFIMSQEVLANTVQDAPDTTLEKLCHPIHFVSDQTCGHILLNSFVRRRCHLFGVVDEFGSLVGIVTLEDVVESIIGEEIVDETDVAVDMQEVARLRRQDHSDNEDEPAGS